MLSVYSKINAIIHYVRAWGYIIRLRAKNLFDTVGTDEQGRTVTSVPCKHRALYPCRERNAIDKIIIIIIMR